MTTIKTCINLFSDMNDWIDFIFVIDSCDVKFAESIINTSYDSWYEDEEAQDIPICDWIGQHLQENNIEFEVYFKNDNEDDI